MARSTVGKVSSGGDCGVGRSEGLVDGCGMDM